MVVSQQLLAHYFQIPLQVLTSLKALVPVLEQQVTIRALIQLRVGDLAIFLVELVQPEPMQPLVNQEI